MRAELKPMIEVLGHPVFDPKFLDDVETLLENADKYVYHYTRWERLLDIVHSGFRLGLLASMNDPRESKDWIIPTWAPPGVPRPDWRILDKAVANYKAHIKIGCFSADNQYDIEGNFGRRGYGHPRMWAQYAGNHTGVCIVFDRRKLDSAIRRRYLVKENAWIHCDKVKYVETPGQEPTNLVIKVDQDQDIDAAVKDYFVRSGQTVFFTKHVDWRDEQEYRWVYYDSDDSDTDQSDSEKQFADLGDAVAGLVLGADFAAANLPVAQRFADVHRLNGGVVKCEWDRLNLRLTAFADDGGRWVPGQAARGRMHLSSGPALKP